MTPAPPLTADQLAALNPGIRHTVQQLRAWGFATVDSGDGRTHAHACDLDAPYVYSICDPADLITETDRLRTLLIAAGIQFADAPHAQAAPDAYAQHPTIEATYLPHEGIAFIHLFNVILPAP